jgi:hypothetical protein
MHPEVVAYTYWNYRTNARVPNRGWRLDYFLVRPFPEEASPASFEKHYMPSTVGVLVAPRGDGVFHPHGDQTQILMRVSSPCKLWDSPDKEEAQCPSALLCAT